MISRVLSFLETYPNIKLQCNFSDRIVNLIEERYDAVIRISKLEDSALIARRLTQTHHILYASPNYLSSTPVIKKLADLRQHRILKYGTGNSINSINRILKTESGKNERLRAQAL